MLTLGSLFILLRAFLSVVFINWFSVIILVSCIAVFMIRKWYCQKKNMYTEADDALIKTGKRWQWTGWFILITFVVVCLGYIGWENWPTTVPEKEQSEISAMRIAARVSKSKNDVSKKIAAEKEESDGWKTSPHVNLTRLHLKYRMDALVSDLKLKEVRYPAFESRADNERFKANVRKYGVVNSSNLPALESLPADQKLLNYKLCKMLDNYLIWRCATWFGLILAAVVFGFFLPGRKVVKRGAKDEIARMLFNNKVSLKTAEKTNK